jgi:hypothetical protein
MTNAVVNFKKICSLPLVWLVSLEDSLEAESKKGFFRLNHWRFSRKAKCLIVVAIVAVLLISVFAFLPKQSVGRGNVVPQSGDNSTATPPAAANHDNGSSISGIAQWFSQISAGAAQAIGSKPPGLIQSYTIINSTVWMEVAANAWSYFQPGVGVNVNTGLPYAGGTGFTGFTDWDLGCYIQAVIDAQKLGLIGNDSAWDFSARIDDVLTFLENRPLNAEGYPYQFYDAATGKNDSSASSNAIVDVTDTGRLFVALNNLINYNNSLQQQIDNFVGNVNGNRSNYAALVHGIEKASLNSTDIYSYLIASGFASFWPTNNQLSSVPSKIMYNIFSANVTYSPYGNVSLPEASILGDPLLCSVFELNNNSSQLMALSRQVYLASEAYYTATRQYAAFSEGNSPYNGYIWEWVVLPNGDTWKITGSGSSAYLNINPIIYNKVAFSFLALYNTTYARNMVIYLEQCLPTPTSGYYDGADNRGNLVADLGSNTNSLILDAALYAIQNNP